MQDIRRFKPSTVSRLSVVAGFYRTCVIDGALEHAPADYVRRPTDPPIPGPWADAPSSRGHAHRRQDVAQPFDFALVCLLGLLGCGSSRPSARISTTSARSTATECSESGARAARLSSYRCHLPSAERLTVPRVSGFAVRCCSTGGALGWTGTPPPGGCATSPAMPESACHGCTRTCCATPSSPPCLMQAGVDLRDVQIAALHADPPTTMRYDHARRNLGTRTTSRGVHGLRNVKASSGGRQVGAGQAELFVIRFWCGERAGDPEVGGRGRGRL